MKKILLTTIIMCLTITSALAKNVKVEALSEFSTIDPPETWKVKIVEGFTTKEGVEVYAGSIIEGRIEDVSDPKRLKRNANFKFIPISYYDYVTQITTPIHQDLVGKYSSLGDIKASSIVKTGAVTAGSHFISGFIGPGVALVEGAYKNEQGNRAKSAVVSVYESTPLSYMNKGKDLQINEGQVFVMNFKLKDEDEGNEE